MTIEFRVRDDEDPPFRWRLESNDGNGWLLEHVFSWRWTAIRAGRRAAAKATLPKKKKGAGVVWTSAAEKTPS